jgi:hypothetical protein
MLLFPSVGFSDGFVDQIDESETINLAFQEIRMKLLTSFTEAEFKTYKKSLVGKYVAWKGRIVSLKPSSGAIAVIVDTDKVGEEDKHGVSDATFDLPKSMGESLSVGQEISFKAKINGIVSTWLKDPKERTLLTFLEDVSIKK